MPWHEEKKNDHSSEPSERKQGEISAVQQRMARCSEGCCYSLRIRWCSPTKGWTIKSLRVITINKRQAGRTDKEKNVNFYPEEETEPSFDESAFPVGRRDMNAVQFNISTAGSHYCRTCGMQLSSALSL